MKNKFLNPKILLVGTGSLLNYGCEAIVQGTYELLREYWPECELIVASDDIEHDRRIFADCPNINFISYKKRYSPYRLLMGLLRRIGIGSGSPVRMNCSVVDKYDIYLSAGGDNFAQAPDGSLYHLLLDLMKIGDRAKGKKITYALWGASVGPFNSANLGKVRSHLAKADALFPREEISFKYLQSISMADEKIHLIADPAFWMQPEDAVLPIEKNPNELLIGLNISPLSVSHSFTDNLGGIKTIFTSLDSLLKKNPHYRFSCISHVMVDKGGPQDDFSFMRSYKEFSEFKDRVDLLEFGLGARKTKAIISQCDLLIASRMHCCVAGISSATPTLFLTYSQKGIGMAQYAYGDLSMTLPVNEITEKCLNLKVTMIENALNQYKNHLLAQKNRFRSDAAVGVIELKKLHAKK